MFSLKLKDALQYIDQLEPSALFWPALLLLFIGNLVVQEQANVRTFVNRVIALLFFVVLGGQLYLHWPVPGDMLGEIVFRSLLLGGLALGAGWIVGPAVGAMYRYTIGAFVNATCRIVSGFFRGLLLAFTNPLKFFRERNERRRHRIEQERLRKENEVSAKKYAADQKCRDDVRAACELLFHRHAHSLNGRFTKETFSDFVQKYMGDGRSAEEVEKRGRQLQEIILQYAQEIQPPQKPYTIESLADWYKATKQLIDGLPVDARYKQAQLAQLNARYAELMQSLMESLRP